MSLTSTVRQQVSISRKLPSRPSSSNVSKPLRHRLKEKAETAVRRWPYPCGFAFCFLKGSSADNLNQRVIEQRQEFNPRRNFGFAMFSGCYTGMFQNFLYANFFERVFGPGVAFRTVFTKAVFDGCFHTPLLYVPCAYYCNNYLTGAMPPWEAVKTYFTWEEFLKTGGASIACWFPAQIICFHLPRQWRVYFTACVSLGWLVCLSGLSYLGDRSPAPHPEDQSAEDSAPPREARQ